MQVKKPIVFYLPELFVTKLNQKLEMNPPAWNYKIEYFYYVAYQLIIKQIQQNKDEYYSLNTNNMKTTIVWNIDRYIKYLKNGELLNRDYYIKGVKAYHYQINSTYHSGFEAVSITSDVPLYDNVVKAQRLKQKHYNDPERRPFFLRKMWQKFKSIELDYEGARAWIECNADGTKQHIYLTSLASLKDKRFRNFNRNSTNFRLDTNLTNLKSELRQFIVGDYVQIDLKNSQPYILSHFLTNFYSFLLSIIHNATKVPTPIPLCYSYFNIDIVKHFGLKQIKSTLKIAQNDTLFKNGELLKFQNSCANGVFYDDLKNMLSVEGLTRKEVKKMMFAVFFSQNKVFKGFKCFIPYHQEKDNFAKVYPGIYQIIYDLKQVDHSKLAILLQRIESKVFIDSICPQLVDLGIVPLTIHDSIIIDAEHAQDALKECEKVFSELFEVVPAFHVKSLKN